jgi:hypothetical protein
MDKIRIFCGGKEFDIGYADASSSRFQYAIMNRNAIAYLLGFLVGTKAWLGDNWFAVNNGSLEIGRLAAAEPASVALKYTVLNLDMGWGLPHVVDAYLSNDESLVVIATRDIMLGLPAGAWRISFKPAVRSAAVAGIRNQLNIPIEDVVATMT